MKKFRAFTMIEILVCLTIIVILIGLLLPALKYARQLARQTKNATQLRSQVQACINYAQFNANYYPGLTTAGTPVSAGLATTGSTTNDGTVAGSRYWMLLQGNYLVPQVLINPNENLTLWSTGSLTTANHSYAMSRITSWSVTSSTVGSMTIYENDWGRIAEWTSHTNSLAVVVSDRNITGEILGINDADDVVQSVWTTRQGSWTGNVAWGDMHATFQSSQWMPNTSYWGQANTNDNLFSNRNYAGNGVTDLSSTADTWANAYQVAVN